MNSRYSRHDEAGEKHEGNDNGIAGGTNLEEELVDIGIFKEIMEEVTIVDDCGSYQHPKTIPDVPNYLISNVLRPILRFARWLLLFFQEA